MNARLTDPAWHLAPTGKADVIVIPAFVSGRYCLRQEFLLRPLPLRTGANRFSCRDHLQEFVPCPQREEMGQAWRPADGRGNRPTARRRPAAAGPAEQDPRAVAGRIRSAAPGP